MLYMKQLKYINFASMSGTVEAGTERDETVPGKDIA